MGRKKKICPSYLIDLIKDNKCIRANFESKIKAHQIRNAVIYELKKAGYDVSSTVSSENGYWVMRVFKSDGMQQLVNDIFQPEEMKANI